jgi:hypothetical protein
MKKNMQICWLSNMQTFTVRIYSTFLFALLSQLALAQFHDDFSDNDFATSPTWTGSDNLFIVTDSRLMLNGDNTDSVAYLATPCNVTSPASWEFTFSFRFNPSASNYARVYLISDQPDLTNALNGYFVMLGRDNDAVSLYKQNGFTYTEVLTGQHDLLNRISIDASVKVTHDNTGWKLFTDLTGNGEYKLEGASNVDDGTESAYFGVVCTYTATRSDKFGFDNFHVSGEVVADNIPPSLSDIEVISAKEIKLIFSESLDEQSATDFTNYVIDDSQTPTEAVLAEDQRTVSLFFLNELTQKKHSITVSGISDLHENTMDILQSEFVYILPVDANIKDVIISEIFADPSPRVGLSESEFVEIYNRSEKTFDLAGWTLTDGSSAALLSEYILLPKSYLILGPENSEQDFDQAVFLKGFPALNNGGDVLLLKDQNAAIIDSVNYDLLWYANTDKEEGGWSLEVIDPDNLCSEHENWSVSEDERGGTPGESNSIQASKPDLQGPLLLSAFALDSLTLLLNFNEKLEKPLPPDIVVLTVPPISIGQVKFSNAALTQLEVSTNGKIERRATYSVTVSNVKDCTGNIIQEAVNTVSFGMPENADSLDVIITEVLFNPRTTGVDFVEILNKSAKFVNLKGWSINNTDNNGVAIVSDRDLILGPGEYLAITPNPGALKGEYILSNEKNFLQLKNLPSFNDEAGAVAIADGKGLVIDYFRYSKEMHSIFIKDDEGVSLERISNSDLPHFQNWKSASASVGFATPGYANSNTIDFKLAEAPLTVEPEIFKPLSGQPSFTLIRYSFEQGGYIANVKIFDSQSRIVKELANNDILGTKGFYRWDGDRDNGSKASLGSYMVWFEIFNDKGDVHRYQRRIVVASSFE